MATNRIVLAGNLTRDPELREVGDGHVLGFRIGHTPYKKDAFFVDVSVWGRRGEALADHLSKGSAVVVDGTLSVRQYDHNGEKRTSLEVRADDVHFAGPRTERGTSTQGDSDDDDETEMPF